MCPNRILDQGPTTFGVLCKFLGPGSKPTGIGPEMSAPIPQAASRQSRLSEQTLCAQLVLSLYFSMLVRNSLASPNRLRFPLRRQCASNPNVRSRLRCTRSAPKRLAPQARTHYLLDAYFIPRAAGISPCDSSSILASPCFVSSQIFRLLR